jgi:hypothetical protein
LLLDREEPQQLLHLFSRQTFWLFARLLEHMELGEAEFGEPARDFLAPLVPPRSRRA